MEHIQVLSYVFVFSLWICIAIVKLQRELVVWLEESSVWILISCDFMLGYIYIFLSLLEFLFLK